MMWRHLGAVVLLQIELDALKETADSRFRDELIRPVERLLVSPEGVIAPSAAGYVVDVHHARHPFSRSNGTNHLSIGFTGHYEAMRRHFGVPLSLGAGGENVIVRREGRTLLADLGVELLFELADGGRLRLRQPAVMHPCAPFTRFCLGQSSPVAEALRAGLQFLDGGMRGFKAMPAESAELLAGAQLYARAGEAQG
ncbi:MAG: hypothetical protein KGM44_02510 [bacterium]|nr:hypothetical protein [bacterium]